MDKLQAANKATEMFGSEVNELKLGRSFYKNKEGAFHTIRYDFKPASIDHSKPATLEMQEGSGVNISFPNDESKGGPCATNYKGPMKPCQKDCVLIYDHRSGEFTLERLTSNINVKIQRTEGRSKVKPPPVKPGSLKPGLSKPSAAKLSAAKSTVSKPSPAKPSAPKPTVSKPVVSQPTKKTKVKVNKLPKLKPESSRVEVPKEKSPPRVSPSSSNKPPTPDVVTCTLSDEESSPEPVPVTHRLSQDSSGDEAGKASGAGSSSSSSDEDGGDSSSSDDSSSENEEPTQQGPQPKKARTDTSQKVPQKGRRGSAQILVQLQHDLSLSESGSDDSD